MLHSQYQAPRIQEAAAGERPRFAALHSRNFRLLWSGLIISNAGSQMQTVGQGYLIYYVLTHSPFWLGMVSLAFALPMTLFPLFGGALADRMDRLALLKITQLGQMFTAALLIWITFTGQVTVWWILAAAFIGATFLAADNPARQALLPELVPREDLVSAAALNGASYTGAALIGPAIGGLLLPILTPGGLFLLNTLSFLAVLVALLLIKGVKGSSGHAPVPVDKSLQETFQYIKSQRTMGLLVLLAAVMGFFGRSYIQLTPAFALDLLHVDARGLGLLYAAPGLGALLGAGILAGRRVTRVHKRLLIGAQVAFAVLLVAYSFNRWFPVALVLLVAIGAAPQVAVTMISTTLQLRAPGRLRGRILSLNASATIGLASLGGLFAGMLAEVTGPGIAVACGAVILGAVAAFTGPRLGELDNRDMPETYPSP